MEPETRRDVLKKIAIGGAMAWTAPVILSSTAHAATKGSPVPTSTTTDTTVPEVCIGNGDWECGDPQVLCGDQGLGGVCICEVDVEGNDICWANVSCGDPRVRVCTQNSDCDPGWKCASSCCGTTCLPPCDGTIPNNLRVPAGATAAG
jgi:hypothetical protein